MENQVLVWLYKTMFKISEIKLTHNIRQLLIYAMAGVLINTAGFITYIIITNFGGAPKPTMSFLYLSGVFVSFFTNSQLSFSYAGSMSKAFFRFLTVHALGYSINLLILFVFVDLLAYSHQYVQGMSILIIAIFLFIAFRYFVFANKNI